MKNIVFRFLLIYVFFFLACLVLNYFFSREMTYEYVAIRTLAIAGLYLVFQLAYVKFKSKRLVDK